MPTDPKTTPAHHFEFFLGGQDLEMIEIARLLQEAGYGDRIRDAKLAWGVRASAERDETVAAQTNAWRRMARLFNVATLAIS